MTSMSRAVFCVFVVAWIVVPVTRVAGTPPQNPLKDEVYRLVATRPPAAIAQAFGRDRVGLGIVYLRNSEQDDWVTFADELQKITTRYQARDWSLDRELVASLPQLSKDSDERRSQLFAVSRAICDTCEATSPRKNASEELHPDEKRDLLLAFASTCPSPTIRAVASTSILNNIFPDPDGWDKYHTVFPPELAGPAIQRGLLMTIADASASSNTGVDVALAYLMRTRGAVGGGIGASVLGAQPPSKALLEEQFGELTEKTEQAVANTTGNRQELLRNLLSRVQEVRSQASVGMVQAKKRREILRDLQQFFAAVQSNERARIQPLLSNEQVAAIPEDVLLVQWATGMEGATQLDLLNVGIPDGDGDVCVYMRVTMRTGEFRQAAREIRLRKTGQHWMVQRVPLFEDRKELQ